MIKVGKKYKVKNLFNKGYEECEVVEILNEKSVVIGINNVCGWKNDQLREKTGYKFFWAINVEYLKYERFLELE
jgi:hypothetical protein